MNNIANQLSYVFIDSYQLTSLHMLIGHASEIDTPEVLFIIFIVNEFKIHMKHDNPLCYKDENLKREKWINNQHLVLWKNQLLMKILKKW